MTIASIALKNIKGNLSKYAMYCLSNIIVVVIFFIFANFILNTNLNDVHASSKYMGQLAGNLMYACEIVIIIFTLVFTKYSLSNFLKSREKEFGLLSMFGLTKSQIRTYVMFENVIISTVSIIIGIIFGMLFSKIFFMAVTAILNLDYEIPFAISVKAVEVTVVCFFILFQLISFFTSFKIKNNNIAQLLKGARIPKATPKFSVIKAVLSVILIISGYIVGIFSQSAIIITMFPILIVVIIGTYFLFSQFSVYFTNKLQSNKNIYYKGTNLITISEIIYKLRDNAKVLFITSILSGITIASAIAVYSLQAVSINAMKENVPQDISIVEHDINKHNVISLGKVETVLKRYKVDIKYKDEVPLISARNMDKSQKNGTKYDLLQNKEDFNIMSEGSYNDLAKQYNKKQVDLNSGEIIIYTYDMNDGVMNLKTKLPFINQNQLKINTNNIEQSFKIKGNFAGGIINADSKQSNIAVVSDNDFRKLWKKNTSKCIYYGYNINHYLKASAAVNEIKKSVTKGQQNYFYERVTEAVQIMQILSIFLFIGTFIAVIFFIATGSILYFKMFNEIQKDKYEFIGLKKIGFTVEEIKKVVSIQSFIMFFLPLTIALLHAAFAVKSVGLLYVQYFAFISGIYLVLQIIYYLFARWMYVKQINSWSMK